ncbi:MAG: hypothetical protein EAZ55_03860 [Cytophagales bacterium]|nr:MAG: hypothetical protein EAZ55_03860 [Cytophagales bacterium]
MKKTHYYISIVIVILLLMSIKAQAQEDFFDKAYLSKKLNESALNDTIRIEILQQLALAQIEESQLSLAETLNNEAMQLAQKNKFEKGILQSRIVEAEYYRKKENYKKSLQIALETLTKIRNVQVSLFLEAALYYSLASSYSSRSDFFEAIDFSRKAMLLYKKIAPQSLYLANTYNLIANVQAKLKDYKTALNNYEQALKIYEFKNNALGKARIFNNMGDTYRLQGRTQEALIYQFKSLTINEQNDNPRHHVLKAYNYTNIGEIYEQQEKYDSALYFYQKGFILDSTYGGQYELVYDYNNFGSLYLKKQNYAQAIFYYTQALQIAEKVGFKEELMKAYKGLSELYERQNQYEKAHFFNKKHFSLRDSLYGQDNIEKIAKLYNKLQILEKENEIKTLNKDKKIQEEEILINTITLYASLTVLFLTVIIAILLVRNNQKQKMSNLTLTNQKQEIEAQRDNIEIQNRNMTSSIRYAKHIQEAMLPFPERINHILKDYFILYKPKDIVSGDFYWIDEASPKPIYKQSLSEKGVVPILQGFSNPKKIIASLDCTGHGVPGAFMSMIGNDLLDNIVNEKEVISPEKILDNLHNKVRYALKQDVTHNDDGMDVAICVIDNIDKTLEFSGAKRPLIYIQEGKLYEIRGNKKSIGGVQKEKERLFTKHTIDISKETTIYLFSDGYEDQLSDVGRKKFTRPRLATLLLDIHQKSLSEQMKILENAFERWKGKGEQLDDVLVMGVKIS